MKREWIQLVTLRLPDGDTCVWRRITVVGYERCSPEKENGSKCTIFYTGYVAAVSIDNVSIPAKMRSREPLGMPEANPDRDWHRDREK